MAFSAVSFLSMFVSLIHQEFEMVSSSDISLLFSALDNKYEGENDVNVKVVKWDEAHIIYWIKSYDFRPSSYKLFLDES